MKKILLLASATALSLSVSANAQVELKRAAGFAHADPEINAYDPATRKTFVTKAGSSELDVLDSSLGFLATIDVSTDVPGAGGVNSVATKGNVVAVSAAATTATDPGFVAFYNATTNHFLGSITVGANPDMLTFTPDGNKILVANEGEPNDAYTIDPEGSVSIIDVSGGANNSSPVSTAGFTAFNGTEATIETSGGRIFGPGATVAQDVEPEFIAVSPDGSKAYVTLQENNAIATIDIAAATVSGIHGMGFKDHSLAGNGFDASNQDSLDGNILTHPTLGMFQPDAIAAYDVGGTTYLVTANEGDARVYGGFSEETRVADLALDLDNNDIDDDIDDDGVLNDSLAVFDDNTDLGRLKTTTATGDADSDGLIEQIHSYGARSFSIWNADTGALVFDSGDDFEQEIFNNFPGEWVDGRSDYKGPEPESVVLGEAWGKTLAFIGLERTGGIMIYDVSDPNNPVFESFASLTATGASSPEGLTFVSAADSPSGFPTLLVSNEAGPTTETIALLITPEPSRVLLTIIGLIGTLMIRRRPFASAAP